MKHLLINSISILLSFVVFSAFANSTMTLDFENNNYDQPNERTAKMHENYILNQSSISNNSELDCKSRHPHQFIKQDKAHTSAVENTESNDNLFEYDGFYYRVISDSKKTCEVVDWDCDHEPSKYDTVRPYVLIIPATTKHNGMDYDVIGIADDAFSFCDGCISNLYTGDNVKTIGKNAFSHSSKLYSVTLGKDLSEIGENAFFDCKQLEKIEFVDINALSKIDNNAFNGDVLITAMKNYNGFTFGKNLKEIGDGAFKNCINLTNVDFSNVSNLIIGKNAFESCIKLSTLELTNGIKSIGETAFINCTNIKSVKFSTPNTKIGNGAFALCSSLADVSLPNSLDNFGYDVFQYCSGLRHITIPEGVTSIPVETFVRCNNLQHVTFPLSLQSIGQYAFRETNLSTVYLPKYLKTVGYGAFYEAPLSLVVINQNTTEINDFAFYTENSNKRPSLYATSSTPPLLGQNVFYSPNNWDVYVDPKNKQQYLNATDDWSLFRNLNTYEIPASITLSATNLSMTSGEKARLEIIFDYKNTMGNSSPLNVYWSKSSNPDIAYYDSQYGVAVMTSGNRNTQCELYFHTYFDNAPLICTINKPTDNINMIQYENDIDDELSIYDLQGRYMGNTITNLSPAIYIVHSKSSKNRKIIIR